MRILRPRVPSILLATALAAVLGRGTAAAQQTASFPALPGTLGAVPDTSAYCLDDATPLDVAIPVSGMVGGITSVRATLALTHTWVGEMTATLISPDGTQHVLFGRALAIIVPGGPEWGDDSDIVGPYTFSDAGPGDWWATALATGSGASPGETVIPANAMPSGTYRTSQKGGTPTATGAITAMNPVFANREANGTWYIRIKDSCAYGAGTATAASLSVTTDGVIRPPVALINDAYVAGRNTPLVVPAPGVFANDQNAPGSGALQIVSSTNPSHGTLQWNGGGGFTYIPAAGYLGADSFTYLAGNLGGNAPSPATVSIQVAPVQPPTELRVDRVAGNQVTLRWSPPPSGPRPTSYRLEGGVAPGQTLAALPTPTSAPILTFTAPSGAFFVRMIAIDASDSNVMQSGASNEVPLYVNVPVAPSAPISLTGLVSTNALALSWKNTFGGGEPTSVFLDVSGATTASIPVGATESFAYPAVPGGTYTFAVRATNAGGVSASSTPVTLTFPGTCSGVPQAPRNYLFYNVGNTVSLLWDPPAAGPAATAYLLNVTGNYVGAVPVGAARALSTSVPAGSYTVSVTALNACGASAPTATQTVVVP